MKVQLGSVTTRIAQEASVFEDELDAPNVDTTASELLYDNLESTAVAIIDV